MRSARLTSASFFSTGLNFKKSSGTKVSAEISEAVSAKTMVKPTSLKSCPDMPCMSAMGRKTTTVVRVEAVTALATIPAPSSAASLKVRCSSRFLKQLSSTTIALSTIMPTPMVSPPRESMLKVMPEKDMMIRVTSTEVGIEVPTISDALMSPRKR